MEDSSEVQATAQRKSLRPYRAVSSTWSVDADDTADVALEDILLEAYVEEPSPPTKRSPESQQVARPKAEPKAQRRDHQEPFRVSFPSIPPPRPSEQARVDALLARHVDAPSHEPEIDVPSIAPVALATPSYAPVFPSTPSVLVPTPQPSSIGGAIVAALAAVLVASATGTGVALATHPAWVARVKSVVTPAKTEAPLVAAAAPPQLPPPSTVVVAPPAPPPPPPAPSAAQPTIDPSTTLVTLPPYAEGHRIFFDGRLVAYDGTPIALKCGHHVLRIGLSGRVRNVNFACGEEATLR